MTTLRFKTLFTSLFLGVISLSLFVVTPAHSQNYESNIEFLKESLNYLASDSLKGRHPGTVEDSLAAYYIAGKMEEMGLVPLIGDSFVTPFNLSLHRQVLNSSYVKLNDKELVKDRDYSISPLSPKIYLEGKLSLDTAVIPNKEQNTIILIHSSRDSINFKITPLIEKGFSAILFYDNSSFTPYTDLKGSLNAVPVIMISAEVATNLKSGGSVLCEINSDTESVIARTYNVAGITPGNREKYILAGAHYDHLGMGGENSGSRVPTAHKVHPGADDNASGVSAILEIGRVLNLYLTESSSKDNYEYEIAISAFGAEEKGLVGSAIFSDTLSKLNKLPALMINFDMVGRLKENKLQAGGAGTFTGADSLLNESNSLSKFDLIITKDGMGPSDHSSFYSKKTPVLYFTSGVHKEYHTPSDMPELINFEGLKSITDYVVNIINSINLSSFQVVYNYVEQKPSTHKRANFKVTLGIIPDFTYEEGDGFRIGPVSQGRPAHKAGLKEGDLITKIGSKKINNIYDYMSSLGDLKEGQEVEIVITREGEELVIVVNL